MYGDGVMTDVSSASNGAGWQLSPYLLHSVYQIEHKATCWERDRNSNKVFYLYPLCFLQSYVT